MGKRMFITIGHGSDAEEAFETAIEQTRERVGEAGATGTILEKDSFEVIPDEEHEDRHKRPFAKDLVFDGDERVSSKDGPACAIQINQTREGRAYRYQHDLSPEVEVWMFFGWADMER